MPQVPGITPTQQASLSGTPSVDVSAPVDAFGGAIGHALSGLGGAVEQAGDKIWERASQLQDLQNRSEVDKADAAYMEKAGQLHAEFSSLQGENATAAFPKYIADLKSAREDIRGTMSNSMTEKMYDAQTLSTMGRTIFNGAGHAGEQAKVARYDTLNAKQASITSMAATSDDPDTQTWAKERLGRIVAEKHALKGTPESIPDEMQMVNSDLAMHVVTHKALSDPIGAADDLESLRKQGKITNEDYDKAYAKVEPRRVAQLAQTTADDVYNDGMKGGDQTKSLKEMQDDVRARVQKIAPDDALMAQHAVNALDSRFNQNRSAENEAKNRNVQTINGAILSGNVTSVQDIQANPATASAYDNLPDSIKRTIPGQINGYHRQVTEVENQQNYTKLVGMAKSGDPEVRAQFMDMDIMSQKVNEPAKRALIGMRDTILKKDESDTRVAHAMGYLRTSIGSQLEAQSIYRRNANSPDDYDQFQGSLHLALEDWQQTHGKPASQQDIVDKIGPMLLKGRGDAGWFSAESHEFNKPPSEIVNQLQAEAEKRGAPPLSDREMQRAYVQAMLKKHYPSAKQQQDAANAPKQ